MAIRVIKVNPSSPAEKAGIHPDDMIISINGEKVIDEIDFQSLIYHSHLEIVLRSCHGNVRQVSVAKSDWEPLGVQLDETFSMKPRQCLNHCVFCFIDQMPEGMRNSLYVKDDDWRLSLMMGNFVTLSNINHDEFIRILRRKASPLYISVQATDSEVRKRMLRNPNAGNIMERLTAFKNHGIQFHCQVVLCPGINDGSVLKKTIEDLYSLWPSALSLAIVPVGITRYRDGLCPVSPVTPSMAEELIIMIESYQKQFCNQIGTRFVFLSDEFYCLCNHDLPQEEIYESYPQIENGVGLLRQFEEECKTAWAEYREILNTESLNRDTIRLIIPTGVSAFPHIDRIVHQFSPEWVQAEVIPVINRFFGESITVTGLIVGHDLIESLKGKVFDRVLISESMLRENSDCFLDDLQLDQVQHEIGKPIIVVKNDGESFIKALFCLEGENE